MASTYFADTNTYNFGQDTPTGNFVPEIFSRKVLNFFRRKSVVEAITNSDYFGEISAYGDTVRIIKEPVLNITDYKRGDTVVAEALEDDQILLILDQAKYFSFMVDDLEKKLSHVNWMQLATESGAYSLKNDYDHEVLDFMAQGAQAGNIVGTPLAPETLDTADKVLDMISHLSTLMNLRDVPEENRWVVLSPEVMELLLKAESKLVNMDFNGGMANLGTRVAPVGNLRGLNVYMTNNAPLDTEGNFVIMAGHMSSTATANAILNTETIRAENTFADRVRGLHVYGRGIVRPESLAVCHAVLS